MGHDSTSLAVASVGDDLHPLREGGAERRHHGGHARGAGGGGRSLRLRARAALGKRLSELADADALIVDLRENSGGDPDTVAFVASYLFGDAPVHLNDMFWRDTLQTQPFFTRRDVPGKRFGPSKPVVVLT